MLAHSFETEGWSDTTRHDHVRLVVPYGTAAWTNSELQEVSTAGIATTLTAPIVVVVDVVVVDLLVVIGVVLVEVVLLLVVVLKFFQS